MNNGNRPKTPLKRNPSASKKLRNKQILSMKLEGKTNQEIGDQVGLSQYQVSRVLNSAELSALVKASDTKFQALVEKAVAKVEAALDDPMDLSNGLKAALAVLKSTGIFRDDVTLTHVIKPTIIVRRDGSRVELGVKEDE